MLDIQMLKTMPPLTIFATGVTTDDENGINMTRSGKELRWIACRGGIWDWCIYCHWSDKTIEWIHDYGDKVTSKENIKKLVPCDDEAFQMYRY